MLKLSHAEWTMGPFVLQGRQRMLLRSGVPVALSSGCVDVLAELARHAPAAVSAGALSAVAKAAGVPEMDLWAAVSEINQALASGTSLHFVAQSDPLGFQLVGPVTAGGEHSLLPPPAREMQVIGRQACIDKVVAHIRAGRLVTVTGMGGIGKTTVALAAAARVAADFRHGTALVELAPLAKPDALAYIVAASVGAPLHGAQALESLLDFLHGKDMLVVLDNCEHLLVAVAVLAEQLLRAPGVRIVATSREPLRARGERVFQVLPMDVPALSPAPSSAASPPISASEAARYSAVQLFLRAAQAGGAPFALSDANAGAVCAVCRRLDGIPLALELAAGHVASLGIARLAGQLLERPLGLPALEPSVAARHRTLEATLDWSHSLLDDAEQAVLRRVSVFRGTFPLQSVDHVAGSAELAQGHVVDALHGLVAKSLVQVVRHEDAVEYRLLDTTRSYAACKLQAAPELSATRLRYAEDCCERLQRAEAMWTSMPGPAWMLRYGPLIQDVRCGLDWAVGAPGTERLALRLLLASLALAGRMSLLEEYSDRIAKGLQWLRASAEPDPALELQLTSALATQMLNRTLPAAAIEEVSDRVRRLATELGDERFDGLADAALWMSAITRGDYPRAMEAAQRHVAWARQQGAANLLVDAQRQMAYCLHYMGQQAKAAASALELLAVGTTRTRVNVQNLGQIDHRVAMRIVLSRAQWLMGWPETAERTIAEAIGMAESDRPTALCQALAFGGCQIALWNGDQALAAQRTRRLESFAAASHLPMYEHWAVHYTAALRLREGHAVDLARLVPLTPMQHDAFATLNPLWAGSEACDRVAQGLVAWCAPEVLRAQGERMWRNAAPPERVAHQFTQALDLAREQRTLAWELRAATSLARLAVSQGTAGHARGILEPVYRRFGEGLETRDLREARALLLQAGGI